MKKILLIDGNSLFFRSFYANQYSNLSANGVSTNGVYTFANMLLGFLDENNYYDVKVAFDKGKKTFRHIIYPEYKQGRKQTPENLIEQLPVVREFLNEMGIGYIEQDEYEADDIVGSLAVKAEKLGYKVDLLSSDRDLWQLVNDNVQLILPVSGVKHYEIVDPQYVSDKLSVTPDRVIDLKGLMGDSSDNIKGVPGVGEVSAKKLLTEYGTIENVYDNIEKIQGATKQKLILGKESAFFSKMLATIKTDIEYDENIFTNYKINNETLSLWFKKYNMTSLLKKFCVVENEISSFEFEYAENFDKLNFGKNNYIYFETLNEDYHNPNIIGIGFYNGEKTYYVTPDDGGFDVFNWNSKRVSEKFQKYLLDDNTTFETYDIKKTFYCLDKLGYKVNKKNWIFDTKSAMYVINPESGNKPEKQVLFIPDAPFIENDEDIFGKGVKRTANIDVNIKRTYISEKTFILANLTEVIKDILHKNNQEKLYFEIDHKLNFVLIDMELNGVGIDVEQLDIQTDKIQKLIESIEIEIKKMLGDDHNNINIASPKQLKELLYDDLKLSNNKKGSTDREALEEIVNEHPVVSLIIEHRKLSKLFTTYLNGFKKYIKNNKVHSKFNQSLTATGRLSSSDPNLQNISVRDDLQKEVRKIFVVKSDSNIFISMDYSQIELRVLAQMAQDKNMLEMFKNKVDIHEGAAKRIFGLTDDQVVEPEMRRVAKVFNFGIAYGLSDYGLARDLKISVGEAKKYIENYFQVFSGLKTFQENLIANAKLVGSVSTLSNRVRSIPQLKDANYNIRNFGERIAINMPIQGTAADIIKIAMINIQSKLEENGFKSHIVAQIHDELIVEVDKSEYELVKKITEDNMKDALVKLFNIFSIDDEPSVELLVSYSEGSNWYNLK